MTIGEYAKKNRISIYQVIRLINSGKVSAIEEEEGGRKIRYVLLDETETATAATDERKENEDSRPIDPVHPQEALFRQILEELSAIRRLLERCCDQERRKTRSPGK